MTEEAEETCSICLNDFNNEEQHHCLDECNHKFHTKCIVSWFRKASTCPNCRDNSVDEIKHIPAYMLRDRGRELRKIARKKDAPEELKKRVGRLKKVEDELKQRSKNLTEFRKENKETINTFNKLRRERWNFQSKKYQMERQIGMIQTPNYPLPALIIQTGYNW
tara:strand:+ start:5003 stop:5494 length:492 start_codon:yes stop_codon:yes gene_type:complete